MRNVVSNLSTLSKLVLGLIAQATAKQTHRLLDMQEPKMPKGIARRIEVVRLGAPEAGTKPTRVDSISQNARIMYTTGH